MHLLSIPTQRRLQDTVYHPWGKDLVELRKLAGLTQVKAMAVILGKPGGPGRWALWEMAKGEYRPGYKHSEQIFKWALDYSPATREWAERMRQKWWREKREILEKLQLSVREGERVGQIETAK